MTALIKGWRIDVGKRAAEAAANAISSQQISQGPLTEELERRLAEILGVRYVVCTTSGTNALLMAYLALGIKPGTEIIIPDRTWVATANAAVLLGATVALADVRIDTPLIDPDQIEALITPATKVVVPVHLNGRQAFIDEVLSIAERRGIAVVEDACQALLSRHNGRPLGTFGRMGCFSMGMAKLLPTGQGGFVVCHRSDDYELLRQIRNQGLSGISLAERHGRLGGNFKFTDLQAAVALSQLDGLEARIERQKKIFTTYRNGLWGVPAFRCIDVDLDAGEVPLRPEFLCSERDRFIVDMQQENIEVMANSPNLSEYGHIHQRCPLSNAKLFTHRMVTLPGGPDQPLENIQRVIQTIHRVAGNYAPLDCAN